MRRTGNASAWAFPRAPAGRRLRRHSRLCREPHPGRAEFAALIADKTAAYIASKGDALGLDCTPQVETQPREGVPYPSAVTLDIPEDAALAAWISEELAIDRAHQYWREADE